MDISTAKSGTIAQNNKNIKLLNEFTKFCHKYPELRFWQALSAWVYCGYNGYNSIYAGDNKNKLTDTYYWENRDN
jgi:hypothetical protein